MLEGVLKKDMQSTAHQSIFTDEHYVREETITATTMPSLQLVYLDNTSGGRAT